MSIINQNTKISAIIKANPASIEAIASIASVFNKLRNPILRRLMAPRVTLAEAASIGHCTIADFERVLIPLGFVFEQTTHTGQSHTATAAPDWLINLPATAIHQFDVRLLIEQGDDPLKQIIQRFQSLPTGSALCIVNSFIPYPLLQVLERKGAQHHLESKSPDLHYTWFFKAKSVSLSAKKQRNDYMTMLDIDSFETAVSSYHSSQIIRIDVRELPMPLPMESILQSLAELEQEQVLQVYHKRVPLHLMEELEDSDFEIRLCEYGKEDMRLLINHASR